jgi:hypothetical protein
MKALRRVLVEARAGRCNEIDHRDMRVMAKSSFRDHKKFGVITSRRMVFGRVIRRGRADVSVR